MTAQAQVEKKCYKNQTAGWLGVVKLDHLGAQVGFSIAPHGTAWLTDDEARLTARAPADPANNPFIEKNYLFYDETGKTVEAPMRALVLVADPASTPSEDRFVPGLFGPAEETVNAMRADTATALASADREVPTEPLPMTPVPPMAASAVPAEQVPGVLKGGDAPAPIPEDELKTGSPTADPAPQQVAPQTVASAPQNAGPKPSESAGVGEAAGAPSEQEEHAAALPSGEETGAAETPVGAPPEGEYASHEEVGSPDAPKSESKSTEGSSS